MKLLKKMMQVALAIFFFGLLATNTVFADTTGGQFVDKDNRKYYVKDDHKAIYWHKIDGKTYYFGVKGEKMLIRNYRKNIGLMAGVEFFAFLGITSFWIQVVPWSRFASINVNSNMKILSPTLSNFTNW